MTMRISDRGLTLIKEFEGFSPIPYLCPAGVWTIGYGSIHGVTKNSPAITENEATQLLKMEVQRYENSVRKLITHPLNQNQFDALMSFTYNLGGGALQRSTLRRKINRGDMAGASVEFMKWTRGGGRILKGLVRRRNAERLLFLEDPRVESSPVTDWIEKLVS